MMYLLISILRLNLVLIYGIPPEFRGGVHVLLVHIIMNYECSSTYMYILPGMSHDISSAVIMLRQFDQ